MSLPVRAPARPLVLALIAAMAISILPAPAARPVLAASPSIVISEVYGGGGNSGATLTHDFIELFNRGSASVSLAGWSVQYASSTGTSWARTNLGNVSLEPGRSYLIQQAQGAGGTQALPTPDVTGTIAMSATAGKVALVNTQTLITAGTICPSGASVIDLIGYGSATNCSETAPTANLSNTAGASRTDRCVDTDSNVAEFSIGAPGPQNTAATAVPCAVGDAAPSVASSSPADGATGVAPNAALSLTFSEEVVIASGGVTLSCDATDQGATVSGDPGTTFEITYLPPLPAGATCSIAITAASVTDTDSADPPNAMAADATIQFTVVSADPCASPFTPVYAIQGSGSSAAVTGSVTTQGVVVGDYEGATPTLRGFYLQDATGDGSAATSDGIFVFNGNNDSVGVGDVVRVTGSAGEFQDQTQVSSVTSIVDCGTGTVAPTDISFPVASPSALEAVEGMLVRVPETMTVTEHFQLGRFGQVVVSSEGRLDNPTAVVDPGAAAVALQAQNDLRKVIVDDPLQNQNPDPIRFGRGGDPLSATNTLRGGDTVTGLTGIMTYTWAGNSASGNAFRIRPIGALGGSAQFVAANPRPGPEVELDGTVRIAALNLLNYFDTFDGLPDTVDNCTNGVGGAPADCRGADTASEFDRQWPKTVAAILGLDADVVGVNEIENDGYGPSSAIAHLVDRLNDATAPGTYAFIDVDAATGRTNALGLDAIKVGMIYRPASVTPIGTTAALDSVEFVNGGDAVPRNRPSLAQAFETVDGARFVVDVNHLKSKGSACTAPDAGDGQGNCNAVRAHAAATLADWLATDPTGIDDDDVFILGDLNSYAKEDPIGVLRDAGFTDLIAEFVDDPYSFVFDAQWGYLDYALGSPTALGQVAGVEEWHINADEPSVLDYNTNFKSAGQLVSLYAADRFRVSDHDPVIVGLDPLSDRPEVDAGGPYLVAELGTVELAATGSDPTDDALSYAWDLDGDDVYETTGRTVTFAAGSLQAPQTVTVAVRVTDEHGQTATDTAAIDITWAFGGFGPPVDPTGVTTVNAGSSLPIKFSLGGPQGSAILDGAPTLQRWDCTTGTPIGGPIPTTGVLGYEVLDDQYKFTWKTNKAWAGWCATLLVSLADGQPYAFDVQFP